MTVVWNGVVPPGPAEDLDLDAVFQSMVVGITGLDGSLVRPRWQPVAPKQPEPGTNWCAISVMTSDGDDYPYIQHLAGTGLNDAAGDLLVTHEHIEVLASFYGPQAKANAGVLRDGLKIQQNRTALTAVDIAFTDCETARAVPALINQQWVRGFDMPMRFNRKISRVYGVQSIVAADIHLFDDSGHVNTTVDVDHP